MDLTGRWKYREDYGHGTAVGELFLVQREDKLSGRLVFSDTPEGEETYMLQEFLEGGLEADNKIWLNAVEYDIIYSENDIFYELDSWYGILEGETVIRGMSMDHQWIEGSFEFVKIDDVVPENLI